MLLNLLRRLDVKKISIAGFDGFELDKECNYSDDSFQNDRHIAEFDELNRELSLMFGDFAKTMEGSCEIKFITPSRFSTNLK